MVGVVIITEDAQALPAFLQQLVGLGVSGQAREDMGLFKTGCPSSLLAGWGTQPEAFLLRSLVP